MGCKRPFYYVSLYLLNCISYPSDRKICTHPACIKEAEYTLVVIFIRDMKKILDFIIKSK